MSRVQSQASFLKEWRFHKFSSHPSAWITLIFFVPDFLCSIFIETSESYVILIDAINLIAIKTKYNSEFNYEYWEHYV